MIFATFLVLIESYVAIGAVEFACVLVIVDVVELANFLVVVGSALGMWHQPYLSIPIFSHLKTSTSSPLGYEHPYRILHTSRRLWWLLLRLAKA